MVEMSFDQISTAVIEDHVARKVQETRTLEYKENLPGHGEAKEFLADVSSFANAVGGDIV